MRIGLDVMGGDLAPDAILAGGLDAVGLLEDGDRMVLVGDQDVIQSALKARNMTDDPRIEVEPSTQVIGMEESPVSAVREKPDSSIVRVAKLGGVPIRFAISYSPRRSSCFVKRANFSRRGWSAVTKTSFRWRIGGLSRREKS